MSGLGQGHLTRENHRRNRDCGLYWLENRPFHLPSPPDGFGYFLKSTASWPPFQTFNLIRPGMGRIDTLLLDRFLACMKPAS
jgi:hypothetical protein